ncbi:hypothetical protein BDU57DRAFT_538350 [Ampelomyces quisqualis]|uniref:Uncharacterized protein n=1 Tax=Ampelomyces quisqualis TaxID=50730 RepID=A0A6A5QM77_AMPQU|nr:hypothetical protein BDU57DRAFT_538350 [Ampelomyces quisqualis]
MKSFIYFLEHFALSVDLQVADNNNGNLKSILAMAIDRERPDLALSLLRKGAQMDPVSTEAESAVHLATCHDTVPLLEQLNTKSVYTDVPLNNGTSMHTAARWS